MILNLQLQVSPKGAWLMGVSTVDIHVPIRCLQFLAGSIIHFPGGKGDFGLILPVTNNFTTKNGRISPAVVRTLDEYMQI